MQYHYMAIFCWHLIVHNFTCNKKEHCSDIFRIPSIIPCLGSTFFWLLVITKFPYFMEHKCLLPSSQKAWHILSYGRRTQTKSKPSRLFLLKALIVGIGRSSISRGIRIYFSHGFEPKCMNFLSISFVSVCQPSCPTWSLQTWYRNSSI